MRRAWTPRVLPSALVIGTALLAAGCGSGPANNGVASKSAQQIYQAAKTATASASSVHYSGHVKDSGKTLALDIVAAGNRGGGSMTIEGGTIDIVAAGDSLYLKASAAGWRTLGVTAAKARQVSDKWLKTTTSAEGFSLFASFTSLSKLVGSLSPKHALTKGSQTNVNGQAAVIVNDPGTGELFVATTGKPYILEIKSTQTSNSGTITFSDYNNASPPAVPAHTSSISELTGSG